MKQIGVSISDELKKELEKLAREENRSVSWIAREILQNYIDSRVEVSNK